jgi:hypothetical protein
MRGAVLDFERLGVPGALALVRDRKLLKLREQILMHRKRLTMHASAKRV